MDGVLDVIQNDQYREAVRKVIKERVANIPDFTGVTEEKIKKLFHGIGLTILDSYFRNHSD
jgi:hypothetical protein